MSNKIKVKLFGFQSWHTVTNKLEQLNGFFKFISYQNPLLKRQQLLKQDQENKTILCCTHQLVYVLISGNQNVSNNVEKYTSNIIQEIWN